jgi:hypothetical protein
MAGKDFEVIDRTHLNIVLQEYKLASTGIINPQTAKKLGEIVGVQALVTGSITPFGDSVRLSAKVLDVSTARMIGGFSADIPRTKAVEELLAKGISSSGAGAPPTASQAAAGPSGTPASSNPECETQTRQPQPLLGHQRPSYTIAEYNAYQAARSERDPHRKIALLDNFIADFPDSSLLIYVYSEGVQTYYQLKNYPNTIKYADKLLAFGNVLDANTRVQACLTRTDAEKKVRGAEK